MGQISPIELWKPADRCYVQVSHLGRIMIITGKTFSPNSRGVWFSYKLHGETYDVLHKRTPNERISWNRPFFKVTCPNAIDEDWVTGDLTADGSVLSAMSHAKTAVEIVKSLTSRGSINIMMIVIIAAVIGFSVYMFQSNQGKTPEPAPATTQQQPVVIPTQGVVK